ncbi:MAG: endo alpha-1,4 polygalactosaminidase, partial [Spirochaetota bacterium]
RDGKSGTGVGNNDGAIYDMSMKTTIKILLLCLIVLFSTHADCAPKFNYRNSMRQLVVAISTTAKRYNPNFYVIGQNALELITVDGKPHGRVAVEYINALDGIGIEELWYGFENKDGIRTPQNITRYFLSYLNIVTQYKKKVLVIDYVRSLHQADKSFKLSLKQGFISFQTTRDCSSIPQWMFAKNELAVKELSQAKNFLYLINPKDYETKQAFLQKLSATWYDVLIVDAFFHDQLLTKDDVARLQYKPNGAKRLVIAYMSVGEAEDYRYYWKQEWTKHKPTFVEKENPEWNGNYKVKYWDSKWHQILYGAGNEEKFINSYLGKIVHANFNGVYLDVLDAAVYFEEQ